MESGELTTAALWGQYRRTGDRAIRDRLIDAHWPLVEQVVEKMRAEFPMRADPFDLVCSGLLGLIQAIERFHPDFDGSFEPVAFREIENAIINDLRLGAH